MNFGGGKNFPPFLFSKSEVSVSFSLLGEYCSEHLMLVLFVRNLTVMYDNSLMEALRLYQLQTMKDQRCRRGWTPLHCAAYGTTGLA